MTSSISPPRSPAATDTVLWAGAGLCAVAFAIILGLTPLGHWKGDEFVVSHAVSVYGLSGLIDRVIGWSPRPFSELLLGIYFKIVNPLHAPYVGAVLAMLWTLMPAAVVLSVAATDRGQRLALGVSLAALSLVSIYGNRNSEVLYWVQGAAAYVPTIAFVILGHGLVMAQHGDGKQRTCRILLVALMAAMSSETGMFLAFAFSGLVIAGELFWWLRHGKIDLRTILTAAVVMAVVLAVIYILLNGRGAVGSEPHGENPYSGDVLASLAAAGLTFINSLKTVGFVRVTWSSVEMATALGSAFAIGSLGIFVGKGFVRAPKIVAIWTISLGFAAFATIFTSYYKYGYDGSPRHQTMVGIFLLFAVSGAVMLLASAIKSRIGDRVGDKTAAISAALVALSLVSHVALCSSFIVADYSDYGRLKATRLSPWTYQEKSADTVTIERPVRGEFVGTPEFVPPVGSFNAGSGDPWDRAAVYRYFGKQKMEVRRPE